MSASGRASRPATAGALSVAVPDSQEPIMKNIVIRTGVKSGSQMMGSGN